MQSPEELTPAEFFRGAAYRPYAFTEHHALAIVHSS